MKRYEKIVANFSVEITKKRGQKNIYLRVKAPDARIVVSAPAICSDEMIEKFVLSNLGYIKKMQDKIKNEQKNRYQFIQGERHYLFGEPYQLEVVYSSQKTAVQKSQSQIILTTPKNSSLEKRQKAIKEWYRDELKKTLDKSIEKCEVLSGLRANEYKIKQMKTLWGSCNIAHKRVWLNLELAKKPKICLEYVIIHELTHLIERGHTKRFYALVEQFYPTWREAKKLLSNSFKGDYVV
ncbi:M48 family metallopeptidase [uncultured Campylobacter sp.]|uniref:M48 family metallopeptidase n=1 Tax=uncultured Campylobacter sp. TaxID=218934 RepID=UPI00263505F2|nr:SprT family zinc-dependent metalloprotease [uncultured Campylobacter sp.]